MQTSPHLTTISLYQSAENLEDNCYTLSWYSTKQTLQSFTKTLIPKKLSHCKTECIVMQTNAFYQQQFYKVVLSPSFHPSYPIVSFTKLWNSPHHCLWTRLLRLLLSNPINMFPCGILQTGVFWASQNYPSLLLPLSQLLRNLLLASNSERDLFTKISETLIILTLCCFQ